MKFQSRRIDHIKAGFYSALSGIYDDREVGSMFRLLLNEYLGWSSAELILHSDDLIDKNAVRQFEDALTALKRRIPVQYVIGSTAFMGCRIKVGPGVLIPRPETEELVQMLIDKFKNNVSDCSVLDIGTGSACIPVAIIKHLKDLQVTGLDISETALQYAGENISENNTAVELVQMDFLKESNWNRLGEYDVIISNPPYVRFSERQQMEPNILDNEPAEALFVKDQDPLIFYEKIIGFSKDHLKETGYLYLEINEHLGSELLVLFKKSEFKAVELRKDMSGKDRFIKACRRKS